MIANSDVYRNQSGRSWRSKLTVYILASGAAAAAAGALLGIGGSLLGNGPRVALATILALVGCVYGASEALGRRPKLLQRDTETPQRWVHAGALSWAALNGTALGLGFTTRLGFALWYLVPAAALLVAEPLVGAAIYGTYGAMRGAGAFLIIVVARRRGLGPVADFLLERKLATKMLTGRLLLTISAATMVVAGI